MICRRDAVAMLALAERAEEVAGAAVAEELAAALEAMAAKGITMKYDRIHKVLGEGNFVLIVSEGSFAEAATSFYDLFRVENGKIAEHWDTIETIPDRSAWKNDNGKFGF